MNVIKFKGGLGNQMFQYALYLNFVKNKRKVKIDIRSYQMGKDYLHNGFELSKVFELDKSFEIRDLAVNSNFQDTNRFLNFRAWLGRLMFKNSNILIKHTHYIENNYSEFINEVLDFKNVYLDGYWQSEKYFKLISKDLRTAFQWKKISLKNLNLAKKMQKENSVSLHIRRIDKIKKFKDIIYRIKLLFITRLATKQYYKNAVKLMSNKVESPIFYIFTDNPDWVKKKFDLGSKFILIDWNQGNKSCEDMFLMSMCKHNIISISTFSWWAAWLNNNVNKIVISPKLWASKLMKDKDIIPKSWLRI